MHIPLLLLLPGAAWTFEWMTYLLLQMLCEMREDDGWLVTAKKPDLRVLYKHQKGMKGIALLHELRVWSPGTTDSMLPVPLGECIVVFSAGSAIHSIKIEAMLEAEFEHVLALAAEYDLTTMWNPVMRETVILHANLPFMTYFYGALWTPVVVIDVAVKAEGFDLGEVGAHCLAHLHPSACLTSPPPSFKPSHFSFLDWALT